MRFLLILTKLFLAMCAAKSELIRRDAVNIIRNLRSQHVSETNKNAFPKVEKDGERLALKKNNLLSKNIEK